jgi:hypothetical protein
MGPAVLGLRHVDDDQRSAIQAQAVIWLERLSEGTEQ